jgi:hypothetical protein
VMAGATAVGMISESWEGPGGLRGTRVLAVLAARAVLLGGGFAGLAGRAGGISSLSNS